MIEVARYRRSRHWAVYVDGQLLVVAVYRKGAQAVADLIIGLRTGKEAGRAA